MFKGSRRVGGFNISTTLNTPIVIHKRGEPTHLSKDEVMQFLDKFISEKELLVASGGIESIGGASSGSGSGNAGSTNTMLSMDAGLSSSLAQLKRIQRDFKGLPPMSYEEEEEAQATTETQTDAN